MEDTIAKRFDPSGNILLETKRDKEQGLTALLLSPQDSYIVAHEYDPNTGGWGDCLSFKTLGTAYACLHESDGPDFGKDNLKVTLVVPHTTILAAAKGAYCDTVGGRGPSDERLEQLLDDPKVKKEIGRDFYRIAGRVTDGNYVGETNTSCLTLNQRLNLYVFNALTKHLDGIGGKLVDAEDRLCERQGHLSGVARASRSASGRLADSPSNDVTSRDGRDAQATRS